ncbi:NB-ARC domain-containing protein [Crossiella sp. SN42]|uniref:NB-ARC domain-containing protein n=1 Tax=Crossiella sp. SN42 TaxID=2944808 RepID=UPI00207D1A2C|nr:NB-ARC domain-containing protein [Crossiella sp. SN42]MCO1575535.1 NB-ARC domain-containing protein [Crossiella sp. SN42]
MPWLIAAVLVPLLVGEFKEWLPRCALCLVRWAARRLGEPRACKRYEEEWAANLAEVPGYLSPLLAALGYVAATPRMRRAIGKRVMPLRSRPMQLPGEAVGFVGRSADFAALDRALLPRRRWFLGRRSVPAAVVISGMPGVGKTGLAVAWGHRRAPRFPDGSLYLHLRGSSPESSLAPVEALGRLLRALGVPADQVPESLNDRVALYRRVVARRRLLIVLDDAAGSEQVLPLMPGSSRSTVLITSRAMLTGVAVRSAAPLMHLATLHPDEAIDLLQRVVGADRVDAELDEARKLVDLCACLPLAVHVVSSLLVKHPAWLIADLNRQLHEEVGRLAACNRADDAVGAAFDLSYRQLAPTSARLFRRLGALPSSRRRFTAGEASILADCTSSEAAAGLRTLSDSALVIPLSSTTYRLHDLLHRYAEELLRAEDPHLVEVLRQRLDNPAA